jgi:hypothetical protein
MMLIKSPLHSMMLAIGRLSLVVPDAPTPWPGRDDARIIGTRLDHGVPANEAGELTREDWPLRTLNESMLIESMNGAVETKRPYLTL